MCCTIWYHLHILKIVKNTHGGVLLLVKVALLHGCFLRFLNFTNSTKSCKASHAVFIISHPACSWVPSFEGGNNLMSVMQVHNIPITMCRYLFNTHRYGGLNKYRHAYRHVCTKRERTLL